ncbi:M81 family metallopeptidase [Aestuariivita sp.]|jgi:microcystin degradation protein MlrC|uniref:M81 family metallopeptidase n=1 Tax=Aestuariivita sp. TaxID=1872407 RepID=UPI002173FB29|nr:M81 family metallopeptidase [Aestuariivita sp.]MCE8005639.1 M81 family metallopeptidase [Aestuariivita sp.]
MTRVAVAGFQHETNTFAPFPTTLELFETGGSWPTLTRGDALHEVMAGLNIPLSGFMAACPHEMIPILWCSAEPGGYVDPDAFESIVGEIVSTITQSDPDAVYLDLHGAMVTRAHDDAEAEILARVRAAVGPDVPIVASFDLHGNLSPAVAEIADGVTLYRTYPHTDLADTGARASQLLDTLLHTPLAKAYAQVGLIVPITAQSTEFAPAKDLYASLTELDVLSADIAMGFPPADIPDCGPSVFAYDPDPAKAQAAVDRIAAAIMAAEHQFDARLEAASDCVARALTLKAPVVIADPQDNPGAGGTGDTTGVLRALIENEVPDAVLSMLYDPKAAAAAHAAGEGAEIEIVLGGAFDQYSAPLPARARVERLSDGVFDFTGPMFGGARAHLGPVARLRLIGTGVTVVVGSRRGQNADQEMFRVVGIEPADHAIVCVKSGVHFMADYLRISDRILFAEAPGANPCHFDALPYERLRPGVRLGPGGPLSGM